MRIRKEVTEQDLEGIIIKNREGYSLHRLGVSKTISRVNAIELIQKMDIDAHNSAYLARMKERLETFGEDGYNEFGFDIEGKYRDGGDLNEQGFDAKGWKANPKTRVLNYFTGSTFDIDGFDKDGFREDGFNIEGRDRSGRDREGFYVSGFNDEGIHRITGTQYGPDGFNVDGIDQEGYNRQGLNKNGKTREETEQQKLQQRRNFLGLRTLAEGYSRGTISIEEYLKNHIISIDELIDFAKKQKMDRDIIIGLHKKKSEYVKYRKMFSKAEYLTGKTTINGVEITEEIVDKVLDYLRANDRLLCSKIVNEHIIAYVRGELDLTQTEETQNEANNQPTINEYGEIIRPYNESTEVETLPIATEVESSVKSIAVKQKARDVQDGQSEMKRNYTELENPNQVLDGENLDGEDLE